jgi:hypothetical protein
LADRSAVSQCVEWFPYCSSSVKAHTLYFVLSILAILPLAVLLSHATELVAAWMAQKPFENPNADPHPFVPKLYVTPGTREATEATAKAADSQREARKAGNISGQYLANTVLFATVLFFASASGKFEQRRVRIVAFAFAVAVFMFALVRTLMLPR